MKRIVFAALLAALALAAVAVPALAFKILMPDFDRTATLSAGGLKLRVSGPVQCSGGVIRIRATVTQPGSGVSGALAYGEGNWRGTCTGSSQSWHATVRAAETNHFRAGRALGCGLAVGHDARGHVAVVRQWCSHVTLVRP